MTEAQFERAVDKLDAKLIRGEISQSEYERLYQELVAKPA